MDIQYHICEVMIFYIFYETKNCIHLGFLHSTAYIPDAIINTTPITRIRVFVFDRRTIVHGVLLFFSRLWWSMQIQGIQLYPLYFPQKVLYLKFFYHCILIQIFVFVYYSSICYNRSCILLRI